jgi:phosphoribosylformimino-5-aminoimidazole carboxamide ribonucleotide (ProFAR) isomerase
MAFEVLPAIDVSGGRLVRIRPFGPGAVDDFGGDPHAAAAAFVEAGARWIHVVDVDLAYEGVAKNLELLRTLTTLGAWVQASGGIASMDAVAAAFDAGAARAVLGSGALADRRLVEEATSRFGERVSVGLEVDGPRITARGSSGVVLDLAETLDWLLELDTPRFVVTAVRRVSAGSGPDLEAIAAVLASGMPTIAAGGITTIDDLVRLRELGVEGAIVGSALLDGSLDVAEALRIGSTPDV